MLIFRISLPVSEHGVKRGNWLHASISILNYFYYTSKIDEVFVKGVLFSCSMIFLKAAYKNFNYLEMYTLNVIMKQACRREVKV